MYIIPLVKFRKFSQYRYRLGITFLLTTEINCHCLSVKIVKVTRLLALLEFHGSCYFVLINVTFEAGIFM